MTNGVHSITKFAAPVLTGRLFDVGNDDEDDNILANLHGISLGFRVLRTKAFDIDNHLDAEIELVEHKLTVSFPGVDSFHDSTPLGGGY